MMILNIFRNDTFLNVTWEQQTYYMLIAETAEEDLFYDITL